MTAAAVLDAVTVEELAAQLDTAALTRTAHPQLSDDRSFSVGKDRDLWLRSELGPAGRRDRQFRSRADITAYRSLH